MSARLFLISLLALPAFSQNFPLAKLEAIAPVTECASLAGMAPPGVKIDAAEAVSDGRPAPYCRVRGVIAPAIRFEVRLPLARWTQRFVETGCGGLCGNLNINVSRAEGCEAVTDGEVALASTDMGHSNGPGRGGDPTWAAENPQTTIDFAYRAEHVTAVTAKALIEKYYGRKPRYSYFSGCSDGGREALMEAQRYPEDFNGIAAGAPAMNFITQNTFYHAWNARVNTGEDGKAILNADKLPVLHKAAVEACDELDGLKDGLISFPPACHFDPATIVCKPGQDAATCLTAAEAKTAKEIYLGAHDAKGQKFVISGPQYGSELSWQGVYVPQGPGGTIFSEGIAIGTIRYLAYPKPLAADFPLKDFRFEKANFDTIAPMHRIYDATDPDLSRFAGAGGKLLIYHGWSDPHISPLNSVAYFNALQKTMGEAKVARFSKLYLFPGGYHCNGGDGPYDAPMLTALMSWVETGGAPNEIVASHAAQTGGRGRGPAAPAKVDRTRPVYPYPTVAKYKGSGSIDEAGNFAAAVGAKVPAAQLEWLGAGFYAAGYERWCSYSGTAVSCGDKEK